MEYNFKGWWSVHGRWNPDHGRRSDEAVDGDDDEAEKGGMGNAEKSPQNSGGNLQQDVWRGGGKTDEGFGGSLCQVSNTLSQNMALT